VEPGKLQRRIDEEFSRVIARFSIIAGAGLLGGDAPIQEGLFDEGIERGRSVEKLIDSVNLMGGEGSIGRARILRSEEQDRSGPRLSAP